jgi:arylformamidase
MGAGGGTGSGARGRSVWRGLDQTELDAAYDQTVFAPNFAQVIRRITRNSAATRERLGSPQAHSYGGTPIETVYFYPARASRAPLHVHVHGGAWRQRLASDILLLAEPFVNEDVGFAALDFTSVEETGGYLEPMVEQVRRGLAWVALHAEELGANPERLLLSGFSSGAHLASAALVTEWTDLGFSRIPYSGTFLASGMYDLYPVSLSKRSEYVKFTAATIDRLSAERHVERFDIPTIVANGSCETPEFRRQAKDFAGALERAGKTVRHLEAEGYNHYEVLESMANPYTVLGGAVLEQATQRAGSSRGASRRDGPSG